MIQIKNPTEAKRLLKEGKFILRSEEGIWEITHIKENGDIWTGGMKQGNIKDVYEWEMFEDKEIEEIENITKGFKIGDFVEGYHLSLKKEYRNSYEIYSYRENPEYFDKVLTKGYISNIYTHTFNNKIWIISLDGYTRSLIDNTVKITTPQFTFNEWLIILKRKSFNNHFIKFNQN